MPKASKRNIKLPAAKLPAKPVTAKPVIVAADIVTPRGLTRDAAGIVRNATNFDKYSDRDTAYLRFYGSVMRQHNHSATLAQIFAAGQPDALNGKRRVNPHYTGSSKATDIGAINRLKKAGYLTASPDGNTLSATATAKTSAAYCGTLKA